MRSIPLRLDIVKVSRAWFKTILWWLLLPGICAAQTVPPPVHNAARAPKLATVLQSRRPKQENRVQAYRVQVNNATAFAAWVRQKMPAARLSLPSQLTTTVLITGVDAPGLRQLRACPHVIYIDAPNRTARPERALPHADLTANAVAAVHARFPALNGQGLVASVKEKPFDTTDLDLKGRIVRTAALNQPPTEHATAMATLVAGAGNSAPTGRGVAGQAKLLSSDFANLMPDEEATLRAAGVSVQNHSYGVTPENYYGLEAQAYDQLSQQYPELVHVFSAGNAGAQALATGTYAGLAGWANLTGQFKLSKNTLAVGATDTAGQLSAISSRGPAYDGRLKPELVACGASGTSEAAALVAGMALLVQHAYRNQYNQLPPAALVKAALLNSADEIGPAGIDFQSGFGQADALGAVQTIQEKRFLSGRVASSEVKSFVIAVPAGTPLVKITLAWSDPAALPEAPRALINDLDLTLTQVATGQQWQPWRLSAYPHPDSLGLPARRGADHLNNVEQITLSMPAAGEYILRVKGYQVPQGPQAFSLVYELPGSGLSWTYPNKGSHLLAGAKNRLRWQGQAPVPTGRLEYRTRSAGPWQLIQADVDLSKAHFDWWAPDTVTLAQVRLTAGNEIFLSDSFLLARPLPVTVGYQCGGEVMLFWPPEAAATEYQIWRLGATSLEPWLRTADTVLILNKPALATQYAVAPIIQGVAGPKSATLDYSPAPCYVKSFLPRQAVTDSVQLDLELTTAYGLVELALERAENGVFKMIQTVNPGSQVAFTLTDSRPPPGRHEYRVRIVNQRRDVFYSPTEAVIFAPPGFVRLFPNPVNLGQELSIILTSDAATQIQIYDRLGRLVAEVNESGMIKTVVTAGWRPGIYLVRVQPPGGKVLTARLLVL